MTLIIFESTLIIFLIIWNIWIRCFPFHNFHLLMKTMLIVTRSPSIKLNPGFLDPKKLSIAFRMLQATRKLFPLLTGMMNKTENMLTSWSNSKKWSREARKIEENGTSTEWWARPLELDPTNNAGVITKRWSSIIKPLMELFNIFRKTAHSPAYLKMSWKTIGIIPLKIMKKIKPKRYRER